MLRPLKLKIQRAPQPAGPAANNLPVATVWVDSGISTLTEPFSYLIPEKLSSQVQIGSRVQVPFKDKHLEGIVIDRTSLTADSRELRSIYKLLGDFPVATQETLELISLAANFWGGSPYDVVRSAIPARVASAEKGLALTPLVARSNSEATATFHLLPPKVDPVSALSTLISGLKSNGAKLVIVPTARELNRLAEHLISVGINFISLDSNLPRADRYRNFLTASRSGSDLIIGMRGAIFAPIPNLTDIYLHQENSEHYFERRTPFWNAREVAWMRSRLSGVSLHLTGYVPSLDVAIDIDAKEVKYEAIRQKISVIAQPSSNGELIPSKIYQQIRKALLVGPVLFLVPAKGYATAISCAKCRNVAMCECGGKLSKSSAKREPICVLCSKKYQNWKCGWCGEAKVFLASRGIERFAEEIGRSFPNQLVIQSTASDPRDSVGSEPALVISTPGVEPIAETGYASVVILQVDRFLSSSASNGVERAYANFFAASALLSDSGVIALVHDDGAPIISALTTWNPATISKREIEQRISLQLPPITNAVLVMADSTELTRLKNALESAKQESRAPSSMRVYGPTDSGSEGMKLTLLVDPSEVLELVALLREINKRRVISKKAMLSYRVNPYSLD
jgi:primosomal protein N' (replication factor Y) (superfamily II helicase)